MHHLLTDVYARYEALAREADSLFARIQEAHPDCVNCGAGCTDCCHAVFDLSLVEAMYLNEKFCGHYKGAKKSQILERADQAEREAYRQKRRIFKASQQGVSTRELLEQAASLRVRCPLLNTEERCDLYEHRPITCRIYGVPTAVYGQGHTCGLSGFDPGQSYPTVQMDKIQDQLMLLSQELISLLPSQKKQLADVLVPVSMALMNAYDEEYLGLSEEAASACSTGGDWVLDGPNSRKEASACSGCAQEGSCDPTECEHGPIA